MPEPMKPADVPEHYADLGRQALEAALQKPPGALMFVDPDDVVRAVLAPVLGEITTALRVYRGLHLSAEDDVTTLTERLQQAPE